MPYLALNAAGKLARTCGSGGAMMTTLPSFFASATSLFHLFSQSGTVCAKAWLAAKARNANAGASCFFISLPQHFLDPQADLFLGVQHEIPIIAIEIFHARLGDHL